MHEEDKFLEELKGQEPVIEPTIPEKEEVKDHKEPETPLENRQVRRLKQQLQEEREMGIALNERVKVLSEVSKVSKETEVDPRLVRAFGTSEEGKEVARLFTAVLDEKTAEAREQARKEFESKQSEARQEQKKYESVIDSELESLEDEYKVDLTSDSPKARKTRREFLELVQSLSPKDDEGTITDYADFGTAFKLYQKTQESKPEAVSRAKELSDRSMTRSNQGTTTEQYKGPTNWAVARQAVNKILNS